MMARRIDRPACPVAAAGRIGLVTLLLTVLVAALATTALAQSTAPGGFLETADSTAVRQPVSVSLPTRGKFTFPAPYNTTGIRLTTATDCGGADCVDYIGYSYWRNINNHVGSDTMYIFLGLDRAKGGTGPTLFSYSKSTDQVSNLGPLFDASSPLGSATGEQWYWSATQPTKLYVWAPGTPFYRYDVLTKQLQPVFDVTTRFGSNTYLWQPHSSNNDKVHSGTLRDASTYAMLGCFVFREDTQQFSYYPSRGGFDECQVDKSGLWLLIKDNVDGQNGEDNVIVNLATGTQTTFLDQAGAAGHSDDGFGYMVAADNWNNLPGAIRAWTFGQAFPTSEPGTTMLPQGQLVYHTTDWSADLGHLSHANARSGAPLSQQYACGGGASRQQLPRNNEIVCFPLDGSLRVLVVAPVMTNLNASGGGSDDYAKMPKGNLDVTGQYFIWTSNVGGNRLDAFIVKVPSQLLTGSPAPGSPPPPPDASGSALVNLSTRGVVQTGDGVMIGGFIIGGTTPKTLLIRARGPSLGGAPFNLPGPLADPFVQLYSGSSAIAQNNDWQDSPSCAPGFVCGGPSQITATGLDPCRPNPGQGSPPPDCALEAAILITLLPGPYTAIVSGAGGTAGAGLIEVFDVDGGTTTSTLSNLSTRGVVQTGNGVMIGGFIIEGATPKTLLIRARGPSLGGAPFNLPGPVANPFLQVYSGSSAIAQNDDWQASPWCASGFVCGGPSQIMATGLDPCQPNPGEGSAPPGCAQEAAIQVTLPPGAYTAIVSGVGGGTGMALVEMFDVSDLSN